jgi:hypothetical protein
MNLRRTHAAHDQPDSRGSEIQRFPIISMLFAILAAAALSDPVTPTVAFRGGWQFGMNPGSALILLVISLALMATVYSCERRFARRAALAETVPPAFPVYERPAFAQV